MPYIEQEKLQRLIQDVNILDVVNYLGIACHKKGSNYFLLCPSPEHNDTHATNCYCKDGGTRVVCKACGYFASPIELVKDVTGMSFFDAVNVVWEIAGCPSYLYEMEPEKKCSFYLTYKEAQLIGIKLPNHIYLPIGEDDCKEVKKITKDRAYDPKRLEYVYCKKERISWKSFFSEREFAALVYDKALEKIQRFSDMEKQLQSFAGKQEVFDVDILKQSIKEYISEFNKILFRARNAYA